MDVIPLLSKIQLHLSQILFGLLVRDLMDFPFHIHTDFIHPARTDLNGACIGVQIQLPTGLDPESPVNVVAGAPEGHVITPGEKQCSREQKRKGNPDCRRLFHPESPQMG
jgi:hypothetical protein